MKKVEQIIEQFRSSELYQSNEKVRTTVDAAIPALEAAAYDKEQLGQIISDLKAQLRSLLNESETPNIPSLTEFIDQQYEEAIDTAKIFKVNRRTGDIPLPTKELVLHAVKKIVTKEQWEEIQKFKVPTLLIVPYPTTLQRYIKAINSEECKTPMTEKNLDMVSWVKDRFDEDFNRILATFSVVDKQYFGDSAIMGYRFVITDGALHMAGHGKWNEDEWRKPEGMYQPSFKQRIEAFENHFEKYKIEGLDYSAYMSLQMLYLKAGSPLDQTSESLLTAVQMPNCVAIGGWDRRNCVRLTYKNIGQTNEYKRSPVLRPTVMGKIKVEY